MEQKFKAGDKVRIVNYGHLGWYNNVEGLNQFKNFFAGASKHFMDSLLWGTDMPKQPEPTEDYSHLILSTSEGGSAQRATKALRFGLDEIQKGQDLTNAERITYEFNDILATMELVKDECDVEIRDDHMCALKKLKLAKYLKYSEELGTLKV